MIGMVSCLAVRSRVGVIESSPLAATYAALGASICTADREPRISPTVDLSSTIDIVRHGCVNSRDVLRDHATLPRGSWLC
jgi:hypothetical protein